MNSSSAKESNYSSELFFPFCLQNLLFLNKLDTLVKLTINSLISGNSYRKTVQILRDKNQER